MKRTMTNRRLSTFRPRLLSILVLLALALWALPAPAARAASFTVSNLNDSGPGSLRDAIEHANTIDGPVEIRFSVSGTIMGGLFGQARVDN